MHVHAVEPAELVLPVGQAVQLVAPAVRPYVLAGQTGVCSPNDTGGGVKESSIVPSVHVSPLGRPGGLFFFFVSTCAHEAGAGAGAEEASVAGAGRRVGSACAAGRARGAGARLRGAERASRARCVRNKTGRRDDDDGQKG